MDRNLVKRLKNDKGLRGKLAKLVRDYIALGFNSVGYWTSEFDAAHDMLNAYAPLSKSDFEKLEKGHPRRFVLPMTATQVTTMTTFVCQTLFGQDTPHKVEGRGTEDEIPAEYVNGLLRWNAEQQPTYLLGYLWIQDALTFNRGIFYTTWRPIRKPVVEVVDVQEVDEDGEPLLDEAGQPVTFQSTKMSFKESGGFAGYDLVSPYDWCCDPAVPLWRMQDGRFAGHRFKRPWIELKRRSTLEPDNPNYVFDWAVEELKTKKRPAADLISTIGSNSGTGGIRSDTLMSRSQYERQRTVSPMTNDAANKEDPGTCDCVELWVRLVPADYDLSEDTEPVIWQFILAGDDTLLAAQPSTYAHDQFPYSVGEGRPSGHYQFSPSWAFMLKGLQDHIDWLKNRHQEALQRTVGNVFVADPDKVDLEDFLNPDKEGLIIPIKPAGRGMKISDMIQQIPIKDLTENFPAEMASFVSYSETVTGANNFMQGSPGGADSATEFAGVQQMSAGRLASVARLLSVQGIVPQTRQIVSLFQQLLEIDQAVRYTSDPVSTPNTLVGIKSLMVSRDSLQGEFDFIAHDGTLPGTDGRKVAAIAQIMQTAGMFPQIFAPAPGNIDPRQLVFAGAKAAGVDVSQFTYDDVGVTTGVQGAVSAATGGIVPDVPPQGGGMPPGPMPAMPAVPELSVPPGLPVGPPQIRPSNF